VATTQCTLERPRYQVSLRPVAAQKSAELVVRRRPCSQAFRSDVRAAIDSVAHDPTMWTADREGVQYPILRAPSSMGASLRS
jgi:hypothetical protein